MWRAHFQKDAWIGRRIFKPVAAVLWVGLIIGTAYNQLSSGELQSWALPVVAIGFVLFLIAKIQMILSGKLFGINSDPSDHKTWQTTLPYVSGYMLMITGFMISFQ